jgi:hypothetical protein
VTEWLKTLEIVINRHGKVTNLFLISSRNLVALLSPADSARSGISNLETELPLAGLGNSPSLLQFSRTFSSLTYSSFAGMTTFMLN